MKITQAQATHHTNFPKRAIGDHVTFTKLLMASVYVTYVSVRVTPPEWRVHQSEPRVAACRPITALPSPPVTAEATGRGSGSDCLRRGDARGSLQLHTTY